MKLLTNGSRLQNGLGFVGYVLKAAIGCMNWKLMRGMQRSPISNREAKRSVDEIRGSRGMKGVFRPPPLSQFSVKQKSF